MVEQAIYARLNSQVSELGGRIYPSVIPQDESYPAVSYERITATRFHQFGGDAAAVEPTVQVDVYGRRAAGPEAHISVADAVRRALQRHSDASSTPPIIDIYIDGERDDYEEDTELFRKSFDVRAWYEEN